MLCWPMNNMWVYCKVNDRLAKRSLYREIVAIPTKEFRNNSIFNVFSTAGLLRSVPKYICNEDRKNEENMTQKGGTQT